MFNAAAMTGMAEKLERRADRLVAIYGLFGLLVGGVGLNAAGGAFYLGAAIGALIGVAYGEGKAFDLRLQAHTVMCLISIEANTRRT